MMSNKRKEIDEILNNLMEYSYKYGAKEIPMSENPPLIIARKAKQQIEALITEASINEFKKLWNKTQHDIKPEGAADIPIDPAEILERIAELEEEK